MTKDSFNEAKTALNRLNLLVRDLSSYFDFPQYHMISVLVQNASFVSLSSTIEDEITKLYEIRRLLRAIMLYHSSYFEEWVYQEVDLILTLAEIEEEDFIDPFIN